MNHAQDTGVGRRGFAADAQGRVRSWEDGAEESHRAPGVRPRFGLGCRLGTLESGETGLSGAVRKGSWEETDKGASPLAPMAERSTELSARPAGSRELLATAPGGGHGGRGLPTGERGSPCVCPLEGRCAG